MRERKRDPRPAILLASGGAAIASLAIVLLLLVHDDTAPVTSSSLSTPNREEEPVRASIATVAEAEAWLRSRDFHLSRRHEAVGMAITNYRRDKPAAQAQIMAPIGSQRVVAFAVSVSRPEVWLEAVREIEPLLQAPQDLDRAVQSMSPASGGLPRRFASADTAEGFLVQVTEYDEDADTELSGLVFLQLP